MNEERRKGTCPHGEFYLDEGCPDCIAERQASEDAAAMAEQNNEPFPPPLSIVKVRYWSDAKGEPAGRDYSFFTEEPLAVGDFVQVPTDHGAAKAEVTAVDVPETEIAAFRDRVKTIPSGSIRPRPEIETTEVDLPPATETPPVAQVASLFDKPAHGPRRCDTEHLRDYPECFEECGKDECDGEPYQREAVSIGGGIPEGMEVPEAETTTFPAEDEVTTEVLENLTADIPPALVTIQNQVGQPAPELFKLYLEAASLLQFAKDRVISTAEDLKPATDDLAIILTCRKAMTARKDEIVKPLKAKLDLVNQAFGDLMFPVLEADRLTREKVTTFDREQRARAAEAKRIEDEKARLARDEAKFTGTGEFDVPLGTVEEVAPPPEHTRTNLGTLGGRDNWKARVVDMAALPDEYKLPDMQTLNAKARSSKGTAVIPGVEFYNDRTTTIRTKT